MTIEISHENYELLSKSLKVDKEVHQTIMHRLGIDKDVDRSALFIFRDDQLKYAKQILLARHALGMSSAFDDATI